MSVPLKAARFLGLVDWLSDQHCFATGSGSAKRVLRKPQTRYVSPCSPFKGTRHQGYPSSEKSRVPTGSGTRDVWLQAQLEVYSSACGDYRYNIYVENLGWDWDLEVRAQLDLAWLSDLSNWVS